MDQRIIAKILARLDELHLSPRAASLKVSTNPDMFRGVIRAGADANPTSETLLKMQQALEVGPEFFTAEGAPVAGDIQPGSLPVPSRNDMPRDLPVLGTAAGSLIDTTFEGFHLFTGQPVDWVRRPPGLANVRDAYSFWVTGDSMYPMHSPGELRFAHPGRPPAPGDSVVVQTKNWEHDPGQGYIKIYRRRSGDRIILEQLNPPATIEIPLRYVVSIHHVMTMNELFGL